MSNSEKTNQVGTVMLKDAFVIGQTSLQDAGDVLPFVVTPEGGAVHTFEEVLERPLQLQQSTTLHTAKDLIAYVNRFADQNSIVFVDVIGGKISAVLDFHEAKDVSSYGSKALQRHCKHVANFRVNHTTEFLKVKENSGRKMSQMDFALFLEDVMPYVNQPAAAELYEIVNTLQAKTDIDFKSGTRTDNGQVSLTYNENIQASAGRQGNLNIPEQIVFGIQVHRGGEHYALPARFRYRIKDGSIALWYDLDQLEKAVEKSMEDTVTYIREGKTICNDDDTETQLPGVPDFVTILEGSANI